MSSDIDAVILWVDGNDKEWLEAARRYSCDQDDLIAKRFRDWGLLKYWFRSLEKNAPWFRKIHFVTYGHVPDWLNTDNPRINVVRHEDFIPKEYLPVFNSNAIELNLFRIKDLSEKFVLFNDDVFLFKKTDPQDFFIGRKVRDVLVEAPIIPTTDLFQQTLYNNIAIINKYYNKSKIIKRKDYYSLKYGIYAVSSYIESHHDKFVGLYNQHITTPFLKQYFEKLWKIEPGLCDQTSRNRFRSKDDITQYLVRYLQLMDGMFLPRKISFGRSYELHNDINLGHIFKTKHAVVCLNDSDDSIKFELMKSRLVQLFEKKYNNKSEFEL